MTETTLDQNVDVPVEGPTEVRIPPKLLSEVLRSFTDREVKNLASLKSKVALLSDLLQKQADEITIEDVEDVKPQLRGILSGRRLAENSIRTYVSEVRLLLKEAKALGWKRNREVPPAWHAVMELCVQAKCVNLCRYVLSKKNTPKLIEEDDLNSWVELRVKSGKSYSEARRRCGAFRKALFAAGVLKELPLSQKENFGIPLERFPSPLKEQVESLLTWKQAKHARGRSKKDRIRPISAEKLKSAFCQLFGYAVGVRGLTEINSVSNFISKEIVSQYVEWLINERKVGGQSICNALGRIKAAVSRHPDYQDLEMAWLGYVIDEIETDSPSELKEKQMAKQVPYHVVEAIPDKIRHERRTAERKGDFEAALCVRNELLMLWLTILPWRQRNIRECRTEGSRRNLFKARIDSAVPMAKPEWVRQALEADPQAEFWQFKFRPDETKAGNDVHALVPRPLIPLLEEYYFRHRKRLVSQTDAETLFVNETGQMISAKVMTNLVGELTLRYGSKRVTPHTFRHIVAYAWLDAHPEDFLTLSKILFHMNINTTLKCYGARFNESNGACGMERFVEARQRTAA